jgi:hypothetical protein
VQFYSIVWPYNNITCWEGSNITNIILLHTNQKIIIKVAYSLPLKYSLEELFKNLLLVYKLYIIQTLLKSTQKHTFNVKKIIDNKLGNTLNHHIHY